MGAVTPGTWVTLDGSIVIPSDRFQVGDILVEQPVDIGVGPHTLSGNVLLNRHASLELTVRSGGSVDRHGLAQGLTLELFDLYAAPEHVAPDFPVMALSAQGTILRLDVSEAQLPPIPCPEGGFDCVHHHTYVVRWAFSIVDAQTCNELSRLEAEEQIEGPKTFRPMVVWDGTSTGGESQADAVYLYRLTAELAVVHDNGQEAKELVSTAYQSLLLDRTPPEVTMSLPLGGDIFSTADVPIEFQWQDPVVNGVASGLDLATGVVTLDGLDITGLLQLDVMGVGGLLTRLSDGWHTLAVSVSDKSGNVSTASVVFAVDTTPPTLVWTAPPSASDVAYVPLGLSLNDATSGLMASSLEVDANQLLVTGAFDCAPWGSGAIQASTCSGSYPLDEGVYILAAQVRDRAGNLGTAVSQVVVDRSPPLITLDPDISGLVTSSPSVPVRGTIVDLLPTTIAVNGVTHQVTDGAFVTAVDLQRGRNTISLKAEDSLGHVAERSITVTFDDSSPIVTDLRLAGIGGPGPVCPTSPATARHIRVSSTLSPLLEAGYRDAGAGVNGRAVRLTVDGIAHACVTRTSNASLLDTNIDCPVDLSGGYHSLVLSIPDRTGSNVRQCFLAVTVDAVTIRGPTTGELKYAEVQVPADIAGGRTITLSAATGPSTGELLHGDAARVAGPVVDIVSEPALPPLTAATIRVTLPYDPTALRTPEGDELSEENVRVHWLDGSVWRIESAGQWVIDTVANTITYATTHLSLRTATVTSRRPLAKVAPAVVVDNGDFGYVGEQRLLFFDGLDVRNLNLTSSFDIPITAGDKPMAEMQSMLSPGMIISPDEVKNVSLITRGVRAMPGGGVLAFVHTVWLGRKTTMRLFVDFDQLIAFSATGDERWRVRVGAEDAITDGWGEPTSPIIMMDQRIRDFAISPDGSRLYLIGDASVGAWRLSMGDGVYVVNLADITPGTTYIARDLQAPFVVGESASLAVSDLWGDDALFIIGSGPQEWLHVNGRLSLAHQSPQGMASQLKAVGTPFLSTFGPYAGFEFTPLRVLFREQISRPCTYPWLEIDRNGFAPSFIIDKPEVIFSKLISPMIPDIFDFWVMSCDHEMVEVGADGRSYMKPLGNIEPDRRARVLAMRSLAARSPNHGDLASIDRRQLLLPGNDNYSCRFRLPGD